MNTKLSINLDPATGFFNCTNVEVIAENNAFTGRWMVPNRDLGKFVGLAICLVNLAIDEQGSVPSERNGKTTEALAGEADTLCAAAGVTY